MVILEGFCERTQQSSQHQALGLLCLFAQGLRRVWFPVRATKNNMRNQMRALLRQGTLQKVSGMGLAPPVRPRSVLPAPGQSVRGTHTTAFGRKTGSSIYVRRNDEHENMERKAKKNAQKLRRDDWPFRGCSTATLAYIHKSHQQQHGHQREDQRQARSVNKQLTTAEQHSPHLQEAVGVSMLRVVRDVLVARELVGGVGHEPFAVVVRLLSSVHFNQQEQHRPTHALEGGYDVHPQHVQSSRSFSCRPEASSSSRQRRRFTSS